MREGTLRFGSFSGSVEVVSIDLRRAEIDAGRALPAGESAVLELDGLRLRGALDPDGMLLRAVLDQGRPALEALLGVSLAAEPPGKVSCSLLLHMDEIHGRTRDFSVGGLTLLGESLPRGAEVELILIPPEPDEPFAIRAQANRVAPEGVGLRFLDVAGFRADELRRLILEAC